MVSITINNVWSRIYELNVKIMDILDHQTSYYVEGYQFTKAFRSGWFDEKSSKFKHWDGKRHLISKSGVFPTGLINRVVEMLCMHEIEFKIVDNRTNLKHNNPIKVKNYEPRPYQVEAVKAAIEKGNGLIKVGTGGGKTLIAGMIVAEYNLPSMIYVVGKDLLYQFHREMTKILGAQVGIIGDGHCDIKRFNVCSIWTAITAFDLKGNVSLDDEDWSPEVLEVNVEQKKLIKKAIESSNVAIFDEAHFIACETIQSIFKAGKNCRYVFGMSGSPWRDDGADLLIESVCGKIIYNMPASKLIEMKYLVPPKITLIDVPKYPEKLPNNYQSIYKRYVVENDVRNNLIIDATRRLLDMGRRPLILVRNLSHGRELAKRLNDIPLYFVSGEVDGEAREEIKQDFQEGKLRCLIASSVFDIGIDLPCLDALILAGGGKSTVRTLQRIGRVIRLNESKNDSIVVDFLDDAKYLDKHAEIRLAVYMTEPMFRIKFPKGFNHEVIKCPKKIQAKISS